ncbi:MAG: YaeQ family protein, partial [Candidatus Eisenbacteria bacterium]
MTESRRIAYPSASRPPRPTPRLPLALGATIHQFSVQLSHVDRGVYESLDLRVARHPSESEEFLCARVLAFCME